MLCCGFVGRGVKYVALPLVFSYFLLAISRDPGDREPSQNINANVRNSNNGRKYIHLLSLPLLCILLTEDGWQKFLCKHVLQTQRFRRFLKILYLSATIKTISMETSNKVERAS